jgi:4-amino-4-deoxy-L-arabinose transferase-like glycosyltransferase
MLFGLLIAFTLVRLLLALRFPLAPDETYYWVWSRHPDWGYYDQGPMIAWWIRAGCLLFGETPLGVRIGVVLAAGLTQGLLCLLARDLLGDRAALWTLLFSGLTPLAFVGGVIATYDPLLALFWMAAAFFCARAIFFGSSAAWIGAGAAFGAGLLSKHPMILFAPCLLLFLISSPTYRGWLRRPAPYLAGLLGLAIFAPNLWWQSQHDWMTFGHLLNLTGKGTDHGFLRRLGDFLGSQAGLLTPLLFFGLTAALVRAGVLAFRRSHVSLEEPRREAIRYLFCLSAPALTLFTLMTLKSKVQANWAAFGWLTACAVYAAWLTSANPTEETAQRRSVRRREWYARASVVMAALLSLLLTVPEARPALGIHLSPRLDQANKLYGGAELGAAADRERAAMERETGAYVAVGAATYDNASRLSFYMRGQPHARNFFLGTRPNSYLLWNDRAGLRPGGHALIVDDHPPDHPNLPAFRAIFERVVPAAEPIVVYRRPVYREPIHTYYLYRCYGYRPDPAVERHNRQGGE